MARNSAECSFEGIPRRLGVSESNRVKRGKKERKGKKRKKMKSRYDITYLNVPYEQKNAAKSLGARWDGIEKKWYVPKHIPIVSFVQWLPKHLKQPHKPYIDPMSVVGRMRVDKKINDHLEFQKTCPVVEDPVIGQSIASGQSPFWKYDNLIQD